MMSDALLAWLLAPAVPAVRLRTLCELLGWPETDPDVSQARAGLMRAPPVQAILGELAAPGYWDASDEGHLRAHVVRVCLLAELDADPQHPLVRRAVEFACEALPDEGGAFPSLHPVYAGVRPCYQGLVTEALVRLSAGESLAPRVGRAVACAVTMEYDCRYNGGLPCAWGVVKLLRMMAACRARRDTPPVETAIRRGVDFLLSADLARADYPHAEAISPEWFRFGFPRGHESDILEALDTLAALSVAPDPRLAGAVALVAGKRRADGRWRSEFVSPRARELGVDRPGEPSRWITLRALRVLRWWSGSRSADCAAQEPR